MRYKSFPGQDGHDYALIALDRIIPASAIISPFPGPTDRSGWQGGRFGNISVIFDEKSRLITWGDFDVVYDPTDGHVLGLYVEPQDECCLTQS